MPEEAPANPEKPDAAGAPAPNPSAESIASEALAAAEAAAQTISQQAAAGVEGTAPAESGKDPRPLNLPDHAAAGAPSGAVTPEGLELLADVNLHVKIELGRTRMLVEDVLRLGEGSVVELDKLAGDPVDIFVNERHVARGEVLVLNDNFCVRVNEILAQAGAEPGQK